MTESQQLLAEYAQNGSEPAFRELVSRYVDLVYSSAVRMVPGDTHLAEDITQVVFTDLAQKAKSLSPEVMLGGWLHRHTCYVAAKAIRADRRRQNRERLSIEMNGPNQTSEPDLTLVTPILDEAINELGEADRRAILLRFFEERDFRFIGQALGSTEEAARKRVDRALEKLQALLGKRGFAVSATSLAAVIAQDVVNAAPFGLAASISAKALGTVAVSATGWGWAKAIASTKVKAGLVSSAVLVSTVASLLIHQQSEARLAAAEKELKRQAERSDVLQTRPLNVESIPNPLSSPEELVRMRAEVAGLRQQVAALSPLQAESQRLRIALRQARGEKVNVSGPESSPPPEAMARSRYCRDLGMALMLYASDHQEKFPRDFSEVSNYLKEVPTETNLVPSQFEIVFRGSRDSLTNYAHPGAILLVREKVPWRAPNGKWYKGYGFSDGSGSVRSDAIGDFATWEQKRIIASPKP